MKKVQDGLRTSCRVAVAALAAISLVPAMHAAGTETVNPVSFSTTVAAPTENLTYAALNYAPSVAGMSSSSEDAVAVERASLGSEDASQPPARRRTYGRPRYADKWHNSDGSSKIAFEVGGGFTVPAGATGHYQTPNYTFSVGAGLNANKAFGVLLQFDYDTMNVPKSIITGIQQYYVNLGVDPGDIAGMDMNTHIWSFTLNPIINFQGSGRMGAYITGGGGYYRKTTNFTLPQSFCDYYYGYCGTSNSTFDSYTSGAFGANGGVGLTYKMSNFSSQRLFAEARYVWIDNERNDALFYPPNSYRTGYFPVRFGLRW